MAIYNNRAFEKMRNGSHLAAEIIVPEIMKGVKPRSVIDIGCGTGEWLEVFKEHGVSEVLGLDRGWFDKSFLKINADEFYKIDFEKEILKIDRTFDLAVTLEAMQHVPKAKARDFIQSITRLAPVVLFSSPIPHQGGSGFKVNEQWPDYWAQVFKEMDFYAADFLRGKFWADNRIKYWYVQNIIIFANINKIEYLPDLIKAVENTPQPPQRRIHPSLYEERMFNVTRNSSLMEIFRALPHVI